MNLFLAVVFFCLNGECAFWKSEVGYYNVEQCAKEVQKMMTVFEDQGVPSAGTCLPINLNKNI
jgi:hypothetical protein